MSAVFSVRELYHVTTDAADWPTGLPLEDRPAFVARVRAALEAFDAKGVGLTIHALANRVFDHDFLRPFDGHTLGESHFPLPKSCWKAALYDWRDACTLRATRELDCDNVVRLPGGKVCHY